MTSQIKNEMKTLLLVTQKTGILCKDVEDLILPFVMGDPEPRAYVHLINYYVAKGCSMTICSSEDDYGKLWADWEPDSDDSDNGFEGEPEIKLTDYDKILSEVAECDLESFVIIYDSAGKEIETACLNFACGDFQETVSTGPDEWLEVYENQAIDWDKYED